jgi:hypothetical protein
MVTYRVVAVLAQTGRFGVKREELKKQPKFASTTFIRVAKIWTAEKMTARQYAISDDQTFGDAFKHSQ